jgi:hypothetical protein
VAVLLIPAGVTSPHRIILILTTNVDIEISFSVKLRAVFIGDIFMASCMLPDRMIAQPYCKLLETVLPGMLEGMLLTAKLDCGSSTTQLRQAMVNISGRG